MKLYEKDATLFKMWKFLIEASPADIRRLPVDFTSTRDLDISDGERALIGFCLNTGTSSPCTVRGRWARERPNSEQFWGYKRRERIANQVNLIKHWTIDLVQDYSEVPNKTATWFIDPPYQNMGKFYKHSSNNIDFKSLGLWCQSRQGEIIVCEQSGADWLPWSGSKDTKSNSKTKISKEVWLHSIH